MLVTLFNFSPVGVVIGGIGEAVDVDVAALRVIHFAHPAVQLVVSDAAPEGRLFVVDGVGTRQARGSGRVRVQVHAVAVVARAVGRRRRFWAVAERILPKVGSISVKSKRK